MGSIPSLGFRSLSILVILFLSNINCGLWAASVSKPSTQDLLQYTHAGLILGFNAQGVRVANGSHLLQERFVNAFRVAPQGSPASPAMDNAPALTTVHYPNLWKGISLTYDVPPSGILRSTYEIAPGEDPGRIALQYNVPVSLGSAGSIAFQIPGGCMTASAPIAWQTLAGESVPVDVRFEIDHQGSVVRFSVGDYDPELPLTIDPTLTWHTFIGTVERDYVKGMAVDAGGNIYVTGSSKATWGSPVRAYTPHATVTSSDAYVAKYNSGGTLIWNTFLGSDSNDDGTGITLDASGNVYISGNSNGTWGTPVNPHSLDGQNGFVVKLDNSGALQWHTFMGTTDNDSSYTVYTKRLALDASSNVFVTGHSHKTWGAPIDPFVSYPGVADGFVVKLNNSGVYQWHTFMGSVETDYAQGIDVDTSGNIYVAGQSRGTWGTTPLTPFSGGIADAFVLKLAGDGSRLWNTFMGSTNYDVGTDIFLDGSANIFVTGYARDTWGTPVRSHTGPGDTDAFVQKLNSSGTYQWHTFLGTTGNDDGWAVFVSSAGEVYVTGGSAAVWGDDPDTTNAGSGTDAYLAQLATDGSLAWNLFMGGTGADGTVALYVDASENIYFSGSSWAGWGSPLEAYHGDADGFIGLFGTGVVLMGPIIELLLSD